MQNETQFHRYKKLVAYLNENFKEEVNIEKVEAVCYYSYRNINRIFEALHHETIGKYVKRLRLEKAAEYLKFSNESISDIAFEVGFSDVAALSKAFKNKFNCSPTAFRASNDLMRKLTQEAINPQDEPREKLSYEIEILPSFEVLYLEHRGDYQNIKAIENTWDLLLEYAEQKNILKEQTIFFGEIIDDDAISETIHCRYNVNMILEKPLPDSPKGLFKTKTHLQQKYAKFIHQGSHTSSADTYHKIYAQWLMDVPFEMADLPTLEFFPKDESEVESEGELVTEIYIPIL